MLRQGSTTTATGPMLSCWQVVAMMQRQEERNRDKQSTPQRCEFHFTSVHSENWSSQRYHFEDAGGTPLSEIWSETALGANYPRAAYPPSFWGMCLAPGLFGKV